ncbi:CHASE2 domain-containing protein [Pseudoxanthomonas dokdonensis]|uniref:diguanylate cyclase n=1 Tax=Pseudoxanthomonas dokdonensis TaxID=344882 RepID=A0A0R0CTL4_9GAMM|nr:CHASE2 domain-containing protein [Pseudoxanthomonas dokdonensis]KRG69073.1 hypothetical protein ABB29_11630 [Pseudoxanthomonas dokdonensis]
MNALKPNHRLLLTVAAVALVLLLSMAGRSGWLAGTDNWIYDRLAAGMADEADPRIVLVTIDEKSLSELGRWPWSRRTHAQLIDQLGQIGVQGIALDLLLSEPALYDPEGDALLARSLNRSGKVVLPVYAEPRQQNSPAVELLPIPEFSASAAALGHADMAMDEDRVARSSFLYAGLGSARWPVLALALYQLGSDAEQMRMPGERAPRGIEQSPYHWLRDYRVMVPYARPANSFQHVSYVDVLKNRVPHSLLAGKWILVGVTAAGMGDHVRVPLDNNPSGIAGVVYQGNLLNMLLHGSAVSPLRPWLQVLLSVLLAALPLTLAGRAGMRRFWRPIALTTVLTLLVPYVGMRVWHVWFAPSATLLVLALGASLAIYRLLRHTFQQAQSDALTGLANRNRFDRALEQETRDVVRSGQPLSLLLLDIDHFKQLNDSHGHSGGDAVLRSLSKVLLSRARRPRDLVARLGGDEFAVLLPETSAQAAATIATTIHVDLANISSRAEGEGPCPPFTASIGIHTALAADALEANQLFDRADTALYRAKQSGRNRSSHLDSPLETGPSAP